MTSLFHQYNFVPDNFYVKYQFHIEEEYGVIPILLLTLSKLAQALTD